MTGSKGFRIRQASRLKKAAMDLYNFIENPALRGWSDEYLTTIAHLIDVTAVEVESEVTQMKRTVGGMSAKLEGQAKRISELESEVALLRAQQDRLRNSSSPAIGMTSR